jgi:phosphohistidine phosphatase
VSGDVTIVTKQLILLRHAKSSWKNGALGDVDRPLAERGNRDAPRMGKRLLSRQARPGLLLASHATRAQRTATLVARALRVPADVIRTEQSLYLAEPAAVLAVVASQDDAHFCLIVVGHNPGLTELANRLLPELALDNLPTAGVVAIDFATEHWRDLAEAPARLAYYDYPKNPELFVTEN